jgi:hypothetical protein
MSDKIFLSLHTLPVEFVYRILDHFDILTILLSFRNICIRLNKITDSYHRYQVNFFSTAENFFSKKRKFIAQG